MKLSLPLKVYFLVAVPLLFEVVFVASLIHLQNQLEHSYNKEIQARRIANVINEGMATAIKAGSFGILARASKDNLLDKEAVAQFKAIEEIEQKFQALEATTEADRAAARNLIETVKTLSANFNADTATDLMADKAALLNLHIGFQTLVSESEKIIERQNLIQAGESEEQKQLRNQLTNLVILGLILNAVIAFGLASAFNVNIVERLTLLLKNTQRFREGKDLLATKSSGNSDEVAALDQSFYRMIETIELARQREKAILENSMDVIFALDSLLEFKFVSASSKKAWSYDAEELVGKEFDHIVHEDDIDRARSKLLENQDQPIKLDLRLKAKDESYREYSVNTIYSKAEKLYFCAARDQSEEKQLQRQKQDFMNMISHDLRSPLTALKVTYGLILEGAIDVQDKRGKKILEQGNSEIDRLVRMVNDLLDAEKLEQKKMQLSIEKTSTSTIIDQALQAVSSLANEKQLKIKKEAKSLELNCDKDRLIQALVNLLSNAIKYSSSGDCISIEIEEAEQNIRISVTDEGPGIEENEIKHIFEQFRQTGMDREKEKSGSGLGLYIVKLITEAHGGEVGVESELGKGTKFWMQLPT